MPEIDLAYLRQRFAAPHIVSRIEAGVGLCEIKVKEAAEEVKIESLFPRGAGRAELKPILDAALAEVMRRYPQAGPWRVWAYFFYGVDERGAPDGGESECRAWQRMFPAARVAFVNNMWVVEARMRDVT